MADPKKILFLHPKKRLLDKLADSAPFPMRIINVGVKYFEINTVQNTLNEKCVCMCMCV